MRRGALPVILAAAAAASVAMCGCFEPPPPAPTPRVDATLALLGEGACPKDIEVRLTNKDPAAIWVSNGGFTVLDASGNVLHQSPAATSYYPTTHFPENRSLGANESAQGHITFYPSVNNPPYTLRYAYDGVVGQVLLNAPPNGTDGCPPDPYGLNIDLEPGPWEGGNLTVNLAQVSSGYSPLPANLTYTLTDPAGRVLYSGIAGQSRPGSPAVRVHFDDVDNDTRVSAQDHVRVTIFPVTPNELAGGRLQLFYDGEKAGECPLP